MSEGQYDTIRAELQRRAEQHQHRAMSRLAAKIKEAVREYCGRDMEVWGAASCAAFAMTQVSSRHWMNDLRDVTASDWIQSGKRLQNQWIERDIERMSKLLIEKTLGRE